MNITKKFTLNYRKGRLTFKPEVIVIHIMAGSLLGTDFWFANPLSRVSAHYGVGLKGEIHQYVKNEDTAWHAGIVKNPSFKLYKPGVNPNLYSLGVEHEGQDLSNAPEAQLNASAGLIASLVALHGIIPSRDTIIGHYQVDAVDRPNCPAVDKSIIDRLVEKVVLLVNQNNKMIKWIKLYTTGSDVVNTYDVASNAVESVGETHAFTSAEDAQAKSTSQVLIVWDAKLVGVGSVAE